MMDTVLCRVCRAHVQCACTVCMYSVQCTVYSVHGVVVVCSVRMQCELRISVRKQSSL